MTANESVEPVGPLRVPPEVNASAADFWHSGADGELRVPKCQSCGLWLLPPSPICRRCHSRVIVGTPVSGRGTVVAYTINRQQWNPAGTVAPYIIAIVELPEQDAMRLVTNVVNCPIEAVHNDMAVKILFQPLADVWLPVFEPA